MQTLLTSAQMRLADQYTIENTPIKSIDLMQSAAIAFTQCFVLEESNLKSHVAVLCGKGNNGGDGLAIALLLMEMGYKNVKTYIINFTENQTEDFALNLKRLEKSKCKQYVINHPRELNNLSDDIIIDAMLGSGLNKPLMGNFEALAKAINQQNKKVYAVDVPTGFFAEGKIAAPYNGIKAYKTICFQRPKINFFFPESSEATEKFEVVEIGLKEDFIERQESDVYLVEESDIRSILRHRQNFSHKGTYGHALIIAGSTDTMGAALLCSMACLHSGAGLTTASIPKSGLIALNTALPEVMALPRDGEMFITEPTKYQAIAIGPGLGKSMESEKLIENLLLSKKPLIIDADALNILSDRKDLLDQVPKHSILTPHLKEFDRLFGNHESWWERLETAKIEAQNRQIVIVLKNQYTFICSSEGKVYINPTGNPSMAQGGMGDVLTGIITSFVAQNYSATDASILGCFIHGRAGDSLALDSFVTPASDVAKRVPTEVSNLSKISNY